VWQFIERGVNVLHVIPYPFPSVWHTIKVRLLAKESPLVLTGRGQDDASALDLPTLRRWNLILRLFTLEYLGLDPPGSMEPKERSEEPWQSRHELVSARSTPVLVISGN
jgi:glutaminyl-peptide cyclotransferase